MAEGAYPVHGVKVGLGAVTPVILQRGGTIVDFVGDGIFVMFGAPFARDDAAVQAVRCARAMQRAMDELNLENTKLGLPELGMAIAVHAGPAVAVAEEKGFFGRSPVESASDGEGDVIEWGSG